MEEYTNLVLSSIEGCQEEQVGQEEAERELQVERGAGVLDGFAQQECEGCQEEAQQREAQPHVGDHGQHGILLDAAGEKRLQLVFVLEACGFQ